MRTLVSSVCRYSLANQPGQLKLGVLIKDEDAATLIDVKTLKPVDIDSCGELRESPEEGCFRMNHSFSPELRKAVKDSRRLPRAETPAPQPKHRSKMRVGPKLL